MVQSLSKEAFDNLNSSHHSFREFNSSVFNFLRCKHIVRADLTCLSLTHRGSTHLTSLWLGLRLFQLTGWAFCIFSSLTGTSSRSLFLTGFRATYGFCSTWRSRFTKWNNRHVRCESLSIDETARVLHSFSHSSLNRVIEAISHLLSVRNVLLLGCIIDIVVRSLNEYRVLDKGMQVSTVDLSTL